MTKLYSGIIGADITSIEHAMHEMLDELDVEYIIQFPIGEMHVDIFIPSVQLVVECDGDYWHGRTGAKGHDYRRDQVIKRAGYQVIRIWESDIEEDAHTAFMKALSGVDISIDDVLQSIDMEDDEWLTG